MDRDPALAETAAEPSRDALQKRLTILRQEYDAGMQALGEIQRRQDDLRATLLRISGAIQVLQELLGEAPSSSSAG